MPTLTVTKYNNTSVAQPYATGPIKLYVTYNTGATVVLPNTGNGYFHVTHDSAICIKGNGAASYLSFPIQAMTVPGSAQNIATPPGRTTTAGFSLDVYNGTAINVTNFSTNNGYATAGITSSLSGSVTHGGAKVALSLSITVPGYLAPIEVGGSIYGYCRVTSDTGSPVDVEVRADIQGSGPGGGIL